MWWTLLLWAGWIAVVVMASFLTVIFLAFADAPDANKAAQRAVSPGFTYGACAFGAGALLMSATSTAWWAAIVAYLLAMTPPVAMFALVSHFLKRGKREAGKG